MHPNTSFESALVEAAVLSLCLYLPSFPHPGRDLEDVGLTDVMVMHDRVCFDQSIHSEG